jgi:hypothetical protein
MNGLKRFRPIYLAVAVVFAAFLAYGLWTRPEPQPIDADGFSSARVVEEIKVISQENHSVAPKDTAARSAVREYLVERLQGLGADTLMRFRYDSLQGPENKHVVYTFDAENLLAEFHPAKKTEDTSYLMFVAHYDSRYSQPMPHQDTVWSYGAADDGYGIGVTLETVSQLLKKRENWSQGVKVLFTDAEEVGMMGMKTQWADAGYGKKVFDNVGLMINLEARGPYGPCLLFETCPGNEKIMELYADAADYKFTYSLTTVVYSFMPNFTDFTIVKDEIPGMNFSTICDVNHYHTDKDNFSNISEKSIQHYGAQVLPVAMEYVTNPAYADKDYFRSDKDTVNFTIPVFGLFNFSKVMYVIVCVLFFVLFLGVFALDGMRGRLKARKVFKTSGIIFGLALGTLAVGVLLSWLCCLIAGAQFKPFGVIHGVQFDNVAMIVFTVLMVVATVYFYWKGRGNAVRSSLNSMRSSASVAAASHYAYNILYGTLALMFVLSAVLLIALGENLMFMVPLAFATIGLVLYRATSMRFWLLAAVFATLLHAFSFLQALSMALTIGAFGAVLMLTFIDVMMLIPLADLYMMPGKKR